MRIYKIIRPVIFRFEPEISHKFILNSLKLFGTIRLDERDDPLLENYLFGKKFSNPFGLAAGFDKNAEVIGGISNLGFGFTEVGTLTPKPQDGNPRPRLFRLRSDQAIINRLGFNNLGFNYAYNNIKKVNRKLPIGINLGANRETLNKVEDYLDGVEKFDNLAGYLTINISSPNTPGLRKLQQRDELDTLLKAFKTKSIKSKIFIKIAPDLSDENLQDIVSTAIKYQVQGLVVCNTTTERNYPLKDNCSIEKGGLSGPPLVDISARMVSDIFAVAGNRLTLIGVGGVSNGREAYERIAKGASLLQLYTALIYQGPFLIKNLKKELIQLMKDDGIRDISSLIGTAC